MRCSLSLLVLLWIPVGCTGGGGLDASLDAGPPADAGSLSVQDYCTRAVNAAVATACGYRGRCCTALEQSQFAPMLDTVPVTFSCTMSTPDAWIAQCVQTAQGMQYDPAAARTCVEGLERVSGSLLCNGPDPWYGIADAEPVLLACAHAVCATTGCAGTAAPGSPCTQDTDCGHDAFCAPVPGSDGGGGRVCQYRLQNGEACRVDGLGLNAAPDCRSRACDQGICLSRCIGPR